MRSDRTICSIQNEKQKQKENENVRRRIAWK